MIRTDDFEERRKHLAALSDEELKARFWQLTEQIIDPLVELGRAQTTPAIERSVLLRMGFSSLEAKPIVEEAVRRDLLGHGAGNIVYRLAKNSDADIRETGLRLANGEGWDDAETLFQREVR